MGGANRNKWVQLDEGTISFFHVPQQSTGNRKFSQFKLNLPTLSPQGTEMVWKLGIK